jgi:hypothetical protein
MQVMRSVRHAYADDGQLSDNSTKWGNQMESGTPEQARPDAITEPQVKYLTDLVNSRQMDENDRAFLLEHMRELNKTLASKWIDTLRLLPPKPKPKAQGKWNVPDVIPDGRYAVHKTGKTWLFFRIVTKKDERNGVQYRVVQRLHGAPGDFRYTRVTTEEWHLAVDTIIKDPGLHSTLFGLKVGACGVCGSPLTDPISISMGIGPICARKSGWFEDGLDELM